MRTVCESLCRSWYGMFFRLTAWTLLALIMFLLLRLLISGRFAPDSLPIVATLLLLWAGEALPYLAGLTCLLWTVRTYEKGPLRIACFYHSGLINRIRFLLPCLLLVSSFAFLFFFVLRAEIRYEGVKVADSLARRQIPAQGLNAGGRFFWADAADPAYRRFKNLRVLFKDEKHRMEAEIAELRGKNLSLLKGELDFGDSQLALTFDLALSERLLTAPARSGAEMRIRKLLQIADLAELTRRLTASLSVLVLSIFGLACGELALRRNLAAGLTCALGGMMLGYMPLWLVLKSGPYGHLSFLALLFPLLLSSIIARKH